MTELRTIALSPRIVTAIAAPGQAVFYLSPGIAPPTVSAATPDFHLRVVLIPPVDRSTASFTAIQDAGRSWCEQAAVHLGELAPLAVDDLLTPEPGSPWAAVSAVGRAALLTLAIEHTAAVASDLAVFDLAERDTGKLLAGVRAERAASGRAGMLGLALEHLFFGVLLERADRTAPGVMAVAAGHDHQYWLREMFSDPGAMWGNGVVLAPPDALAGLAFAEVAERVLLPTIARRHAGVPGPGAGAPPAAGATDASLEPELAAALRAGEAVLAPRLSSLIPARPDRLLH